MTPTKTEIVTLLQNAKRATTNPGWLAHSLAVGDTAGKIAIALNQAQAESSGPLFPETFPLDVDKIIKMGYLHDIGKIVDPVWKHPVNGYTYLKEHGYPAEYCDVCMVHHYINNDPNCTFSTLPDPEDDKIMIDFVKNHQFTFEEKLIALSDAMCTVEVTTLDKRIVDVLSRHGTNPHTGERIAATVQLKEYIDLLLGYNLYDLFPEIKERL